jgi:hypothetical protein
MVGESGRLRSGPRGRAFGLRALALATAAALLPACTTFEDSRVRQLLHEKGFGTRAQGVASAENFVTGGDQVQFIIDPNLYLQPGFEQLYLLAQPQPVQIDGTILVPYVGSVYVLGLKEQELASLVGLQLEGLRSTPIQLQARIISTGKGFYMYGEVETAARYVPLTNGDLTLLDVVTRAPITDLANMGRVKVIKPDAQDPLVVVVNVREILETGNTTFNLRIGHQDIIYIPPTFLGHISRFIEKLLAPIGNVTRAALGLSFARSGIDYLFYNEADALLFRGQRRF